jgi:hypothetical protein
MFYELLFLLSWTDPLRAGLEFLNMGVSQVGTKWDPKI